MTLGYTRSDMVWNWKVKVQGHAVNNTTRSHFISSYNRASSTFARWQYQYYMAITAFHCHSLGGVAMLTSNYTAWVRTLWVHSSKFYWLLCRSSVSSHRAVQRSTHWIDKWYIDALQDTTGRANGSPGVAICTKVSWPATLLLTRSRTDVVPIRWLYVRIGSRRRLRSADVRTCPVPRTRTQFCDGNFAVARSSAGMNSLPAP